MKKGTYRLLAILMFAMHMLASSMLYYYFNAEVSTNIIYLIIDVLGANFIQIFAFICVYKNVTFKKPAMIVGILTLIFYNIGTMFGTMGDTQKPIVLSCLLSVITALPFILSMFLLHRYHDAED